MSNYYHALIWIDHHQAKIYQFNVQEFAQSKVQSTNPHLHLHHKANTRGSGHAAVDHAFLEQVAKAISDSEAILITGPASAKDELAAHIRAHHPELAKHISGIEALDHPTDGELLALGRRFFRADDRMHWQSRART
jgi:stalled ribosome rescue protein Dom34